MKKALRRSLVAIIIIAVSLGIGFSYERICDKIDRHNYPLQYSEYVGKYSKEYGVPENIVYAVIKTESGFDSSAVSGKGAVGLMQITPETFEWLMLYTDEKLDEGMLYNPETNIKYGVCLLSQLYKEFGVWDTVYAAYNAGMAKVQSWLLDERYAGENGTLKEIPYKETSAYIKKVQKAVNIYDSLYNQ